MNRFIGLACTVVIGLAILPLHALAQEGMPGFKPPDALGPQLKRLFGSMDSFTAQADMRMVDKEKKTTEMVMEMAMNKGKTRMEIDLTKIKSPDMPAEMSGQLKQMGMGSIILITRPDTKVQQMVYPGLKAYVETPLTEQQLAAESAKPDIQSTPQGKETVDGRQCTKTKMVITEKDGTKFEALVWNAAELKDFPVQMQFEEKGDKYHMKFKNIKLAAPGNDAFETGAGFSKHASMDGIMQIVMQKMLGGGIK